MHGADFIYLNCRSGLTTEFRGTPVTMADCTTCGSLLTYCGCQTSSCTTSKMSTLKETKHNKGVKSERPRWRHRNFSESINNFFFLGFFLLQKMIMLPSMNYSAQIVEQSHHKHQMGGHKIFRGGICPMSYSFSGDTCVSFH